MAGASLSGIRKKREVSLAAVAVTAGLVIALNLYGLTIGITTVLPHLFYVPVVLAAYYFPRRGVVFAAALALVYLLMVALFFPRDPAVLVSAAARAVVYVLIAAVISFLTLRLHRESDERVRLGNIVESSTDAVIGLSLEGMVTSWNHGAERLYGYSPEEMIGNRISLLFPPGEADDFGVFREKILAGGIIGHHEAERITRDGKRVHIALSVSPIRNSLDEIVGISTIAHDITIERELAEDVRRSHGELAARERFLNRLIETIPSPVFYKDRYGRYTGCNSAFEAYIGRSRAEIVGRTVYDISPREQADVYAARDRELFDHPGVQSYESVVRYADGTLRPVIFFKATLSSADDSVDGIVGVILDISDRKRAEEAIRDYAEWYSAILRTTHDGYILAGASGRITEVNENYCRMTGFPREELLGKHLEDLGEPGSGETGRPAFPLAFPPGMNRFEARHRTRDGIGIDVEISATVEERNHRTIVFVRDISERKRAEHARRESEKRYREFINFLPQPVFELGETGRVSSINKIAYEVFGCSAGDPIRGMDAADLLAPPDRDRAGANFRRVMNGEVTGGIEYTAQRRDGSTFPVIMYTSPIIREGNVTGIRGVITDISERKRFEEALFQANRKLNILSSITRHDILNQLMILRGYLALSGELTGDPKILEHIRKEEAAAEAIGRMIEFTRYYQDIGVQAPAWSNVGEVIRSAAATLNPGAVLLAVDIPDVEVFADPLIEKVFYNLMENSIRHGGHVTRVEFLFRKTDRGAVITYRDDGVGIPAADKERLFTRGFGKHTGLGLFISREILAITGILINENGEPGKGVRFEITVPEGNYRFVIGKGPAR